MSVPGDQAPVGVPRRPLAHKVAWIASGVVLGALPMALLVMLFSDAVLKDLVPVEPRAYYAAAEAVLRGDTPYVVVDDSAILAGEGYVYPPLTAIGAIPFTALSLRVAGLLMMALVVAAVLATPLVLGVRDWRCYGLVLLWPPVISVAQTSNVNALLALAVALVWRFRERPISTGGLLGIAVATKLMLWPVGVWMVATRRFAAAAWAGAFAAVLLLGSWAAIAFHGMTAYPDLIRRVSSLEDDRGYNVYALALDLGAPSSGARLLWAALPVTLLVAAVILGRKGEDRAAFILAIAVTLSATPVAWLHYFVFLVVVVGLAQPRLSPLWFVPLLMFFTDGGNNPGYLAAAATMAVAAVTVGLALRASLHEPPEARVELRLHAPTQAESA